MQDLSPVHEWISEHLLGGGGWVFNGSALWLKDGHTVVYTCRARDMRNNGQSHVGVQFFTIDRTVTPVQWLAQGEPALLPIKTDRIVGWDSGPEDARVFEFRSEVWVIFNMLREDAGRQMHLFNVTKALKTPLEITSPIMLKLSGIPIRPVEKNWTPFVFENKLYFIYLFVPLVLLEYVDITDENKEATCQCIYIEPNKAAQPQFRGGSVALEVVNSNPPKISGYLHTTVPFPQDMPDLYDRKKLPWPARLCSFVYRTHKFEVTLQNPPQISIGPEMTFFNHQIEQIYGHNNIDDSVVVNVDDQISVVTSLNYLISNAQKNNIKI